MGVVIKDLTVEGDKGKGVLRSIFNTGASHSSVRRDKAEQLTTIVSLAIPLQFRLGDGQATLTVSESCHLFFEVKGYRYYFVFYIADDLAQELIIGADAMKVWKIKPVPDEDDVQIDPSVLELWLVGTEAKLEKH